MDLIVPSILITVMKSLGPCTYMYIIYCAATFGEAASTEIVLSEGHCAEMRILVVKVKKPTTV